MTRTGHLTAFHLLAHFPIHLVVLTRLAVAAGGLKMRDVDCYRLSAGF